MSRRSALLVVTTVYAVVLVGAAAWFVAWDTHPLWAVFVIDLAATGAVFASSTATRNASVYDPYWSVVPPFIAMAFAVRGEGPSLRTALVMIAVGVWAVRLTTNWARGWAGRSHEDWRYGMLRERARIPGWAVDLLAVHLYPTLQVWVGCLGLYAALTLGDAPVNVLDAAAVVVIVAAAIIQLVADEQLRRHRRTRPAAPMRSGLWARARHPNYFGEATVWWGVWLFGVAAHPDAWWWTAVGPVTMTALLRGASVPMMDRRSLERRPGYDEVMRDVPAMLPLGRRWRRGSA